MLVVRLIHANVNDSVDVPTHVDVHECLCEC